MHTLNLPIVHNTNLRNVRYYAVHLQNQRLVLLNRAKKTFFFYKLLLAANETLTVRRYLASLLASHELRDH